jgi:transposase InsO family protein
VLQRPIESAQYAAHDYRNRWDNAPMESFNGRYKVECVHDEHFATRAEACRATLEYIGYYNHERRHSSIGYITSDEYGRRWHDNEERVREVQPRVTHRRPILGSLEATEPASRG